MWIVFQKVVRKELFHVVFLATSKVAVAFFCTATVDVLSYLLDFVFSQYVFVFFPLCKMFGSHWKRCEVLVC